MRVLSLVIATGLVAFHVQSASAAPRGKQAKSANLGPREKARAKRDADRLTRREQAERNKKAKDMRRYGKGSTVARTEIHRTEANGARTKKKSITVKRANGTRTTRSWTRVSAGSKRRGTTTTRVTAVREAPGIRTSAEREQNVTRAEGRRSTAVKKNEVTDDHPGNRGHRQVKRTRMSEGKTSTDLDGRVTVEAASTR